MQTVTEAEVERLLGRLQHVVEKSPVHLRPKRRQIVRGMRAALSAMADGVSLEGLRDELLYELTGALPDMPPPPPVQVERERQPTALQLRVAQRLSEGASPCKVAEEVGCSPSAIYRIRKNLCQSDGE